MKSVELFAGAGGLALGVSLAGFTSAAIVEWDKWACDTIRQNQARGYPLVSGWPLWEGDVRAFEWAGIAGDDIALVAGGPPCQPFSLAGKHGGHMDDRDMFPAAAEVIRTLAPRAFLIENVKGLTRQSFANYYQYILLRLEFPEIVRTGGETWEEHWKRLQREKSSVTYHGLRYKVLPTLVNAADYGVPQRRERVFIVGFRSDLDIRWSFPEPTHSLDMLLREQWITGGYWERHGIRPPALDKLERRFRLRARRLEKTEPPRGMKPWRTVRDALADVPGPRADGGGEFFNHKLQTGAKTYPGHTGSPLDLPAKTLKAGNHGVPGGENMIVLDDGSVRYLTVREAARMQTFPDGYVFHGSWSETMRQLGNAVPVQLAAIAASSIHEKLIEHEMCVAGASKTRKSA